MKTFNEIASLSGLLALGFLAACSNGGVSAGGACQQTSQCSTGLFCVSGKCGSAQCATSADCLSSQVCTAGSCAAAGGGGTSTGSTVGSTGSIPTIAQVAVNAAGGTFTVTGTHLSTITGAQLSGGDLAAPVTLKTSGATDTGVIATTAGNLQLTVGVIYNLVVSTAQAQSASTTITYTIPAGSITSSLLASPLTVTSGSALSVAAPYDGAFNTGANGGPASTSDTTSLSIKGEVRLDANAAISLVYMKTAVSAAVGGICVDCDGSDVAIAGGCNCHSATNYVTGNEPRAGCEVPFSTTLPRSWECDCSDAVSSPTVTAVCLKITN